ncbi:MAG: UbiD family decarboxylase [Planctomycetaceae bacterium]|jgi:4-hydroxy-3-polyprenylbenzoate decarboxylase|nr:UbiD family decarboxylase [Planctomycetaceae bacterium]
MYTNLRQCTDDLIRSSRMIVIDEPFDWRFEVAALQRRLFAAGAPAVLLTGCGGFPLVLNLFGTMERLRYIFRDGIEPLRRVLRLTADPSSELASFRLNFSNLQSSFKLLGTARFSRPKVVRNAPVLRRKISLRDLPHVVSWSRDGGAFITLPQVYTQPPDELGLRGILRSNVGMYRVQISGNDYSENEAGIHYQLHRGIAAHHAAALRRGESLPVNIFIGGSPAMTLAAVMPLPENVSELTFAGMLGRHRIPMVLPRDCRLPIYAEADFCITGYLDLQTLKREGAFGDHLGYYSMPHEFPVLRVENVYCRDDAMYPLTVVGRPPQEDSMFGEFIHELVGDIVPQRLPGVHAVRAVDEAGVHPLCLAIGSECYLPYRSRRAYQLHTLAHAILGFGQLSLTKYLLLVAREDDYSLTVHDTAAFFTHLLSRVDWRTDLHFVTETTSDTLDYTDAKLHHGSKLIVTTCGEPIRALATAIDNGSELPSFFVNPRVVMPGVLVTEVKTNAANGELGVLVESCRNNAAVGERTKFPLIVVVDNSENAKSIKDFLWTTFTKSDPSSDVYGFGQFTTNKHWGTTGSLVIDARKKKHHAPELEEDESVEKRVTEKIKRLATKGNALAGFEF